MSDPTRELPLLVLSSTSRPEWHELTDLADKKPFQWLFTRTARDVDRRLEVLEYRATTRRYAMEQIAEYVAFSSLPGDYCEFGVYQGLSFAAAFQAMHAVAPSMRFVAFDSFEGLPEPRGRDAEGVPISGFDAHAYASTRAEFERSVVAAGVDRNRMRIVEGWFDRTLVEPSASAIGVQKIAVAWVDCDLYESTLPVLEYLTSRLEVGSVIAFDDWRCYRNLPDYGEQRACAEWLARHPSISLRELFGFGWHGQVFTVGSL